MSKNPKYRANTRNFNRYVILHKGSMVNFTYGFQNAVQKAKELNRKTEREYYILKELGTVY